jgi:nucleotide-binding universal stress UspA family protein
MPFDEIVVGFDGGERGRDALRLGELLARTTGGRLRIARVYLSGSPRSEEAEQLSANLDAILAASDREFESLPLFADSPARALHELAEAEPRVGLIVLGSSHRAGLGRVMPGGVAQRLLSGAPCNVAVAPRAYARPDGRRGEHDPLSDITTGDSDSPLPLGNELRVIGVGFDGSREAREALDLAAGLGRLAEATLRVIAVGQPVPTSAESDAAPSAQSGPSPVDLQSTLHTTVADLPSELRALPIFDQGAAATQLLARAEEGVDLLVIGSRGYGPMRAALLGSVSTRILDHSPCPVLITPRSVVD